MKNIGFVVAPCVPTGAMSFDKIKSGDPFMRQALPRHQVPDRGNDQKGADPLLGPGFRARGCDQDRPPEPVGLVRPMLGDGSVMGNRSSNSIAQLIIVGCLDQKCNGMNSISLPWCPMWTSELIAVKPQLPGCCFAWTAPDNGF